MSNNVVRTITGVGAFNAAEQFASRLRGKYRQRKTRCAEHSGFFSIRTQQKLGSVNYLASMADLAASAAGASAAAGAACSAAGAACSAAGAACSAAGAAGASAAGAGASTAGAAGAAGASSFLPQATRAAEAITVAKMKAFFMSIPLRVEKVCSTIHMHGDLLPAPHPKWIT